MSLIPPYLIFLTAGLVVFPSFLAILLRFFLYQHLSEQADKVRRLVNQQSPGMQPKIVEELEKRFAQASSSLDQVNTAALIDQVYSQEKVAGIACEQIDYLSRILPNLLLAFGLMGTFIGITINLTSLSQTISQSNVSDVNTLVQQLQEPLQGMGIAFITSLTGLFFSALLTVANFLFNTSLAKYRLINSLEDYLDNIYHPTLQGQTRLDKVVKGMADTFDLFLTRFGQTVREGVESALKDKIQEITEANLNAAHLAEQVYTQLANAAGTISRGADDFQESANRFREVAQTFNQSEFPQKLSEATANLASTQRNFSESALSLSETVESMGTALSQVHDFSQHLAKMGAEISSLNQSSVQVLELHQTNQQSLAEIIPQLQEGAESFESVVTIIEQLQRRIVVRVDSLDQVQAELNKLVEAQNNYTNQVGLGMESLAGSLVESMRNQSEHSSLQSQAIVDNLAETSHHLSEIKSELSDLGEIWKNQLKPPVFDRHISDANFLNE